MFVRKSKYLDLMQKYHEKINRHNELRTEAGKALWERDAQIKLQNAQIEYLRWQLADAKKRPRRADGRFVSVKELPYGSDN